MHYHIMGKLFRKEVLSMSHEDYVQLIESKVVPSLKAILQDNTHGKVLGGGLIAGSRNFVMIVDLKGQDSHRWVRLFLTSLPIFEYYDWEVAPLETFEELLSPFKNS